MCLPAWLWAKVVDVLREGHDCVFTRDPDPWGQNKSPLGALP